MARSGYDGRMTKLALIVIPYELGRLREGVGRGPEHLIDRGAASALGRGHVRTETIVLDDAYEGSGSGEADAGFALMRLAADAVRQAIAAGEFPIVLSGSCFTAVGTVAGLGETAPAVVWLDAHSDFSEPSTSTSGYLDSMGLAILTGSAWQGMLAEVPGARPLPETAVVLAGARAFDPSEWRRLQASGIRHVPIDRLRTPDALVEAVQQLRPAMSGLYVHIDLDVLGAEAAGVNVFSAPEGLSATELDDLVAALMRTFPVRAVTLSAYDPACDIDDRLPPIAHRLLTTIAREHTARTTQAHAVAPDAPAIGERP